MSLIRSTSSGLQVTPVPQTFYRDFPLPQYAIVCCVSRFIVLVAGRRFGKTTLALHKMLCHAVAIPGQICYFIAPTAKQAREIAWRRLLELTPFEFRRSVRQSSLELELINGSILKLHGPEFLRGVGLDFVVLDEFAYMPPKLWPEVVLPMLADREGRALISSTPAGFNHFYDLYSNAQTKPGWAAFQFSTREGGFVSESELEHLRSAMDFKLYAQEIQARFEPQEGRVYFAFAHELHVRELTPLGAHRLLIGLDFNVDPMTAIVAQRIGDECHVYDEIVLRHSNTPEMMRALTSRYPQKGLVHPDPTGAARKTSAEAGVTDHAIVEQFGWDVYRTNPYPVVNRINAVNAMLKNANGRVRLLIDPKCHHLTRSLEGLVYKEGTRIPDTSTGLDHAADALGYLIAAVFSNVNSCSITNALTGADLMN